MKEELARLKALLYFALLRTKPEDTTDSEARICYELSLDPDIREIFRRAVEAEKKATGTGERQG